MSAHTKEPWVFDDTAQPDPIRITTADRMRNRKAPIAQVDCDYSEPFASEQRANLQLIAAAPRLLQELQRLVNIADSGLFRDRAELSIATHPAYDDARELIKSVTGAPE